MSAALVSQRYARALVDSFAEDAQVDQSLEALRDFALAYADLDELRSVLENPSIASQKRGAVFTEILDAASYDPTTERFLQTLFARGRLGLIQDVVSAVETLANQRLNRTHARINGAADLSAGELDRIRAALETHSGKTVITRSDTDPDLLGGVVVRIGGLVIDGSLRSRLENIRAALLVEENV